jgi:Icc-related predicted phosphoesterase
MIRAARLRGLGRLEPIDVLVSHAPPHRTGDGPDSAHQGFEAFDRLIEVLQPRLMVHGHIHPHGFARADRQIGRTRIVNAIPHKLFEID